MNQRELKIRNAWIFKKLTGKLNDNLKECLRLKAEVDHADLQLKLVIVRADVVMHQIFAMRILKWIEGLLDKHAYFRTLFADIIEMNDNVSLNRAYVC